MDWELHEGDCRLWLPTLADRSVDVVIADPPYSAHVHGKSRRGNALPDAANGRGANFSRVRDLGFGAMTPELMASCAAQFSRLCRRWCLVFSDVELAGEWRKALETAGLEYIRTGAWVKLASTPQFTGDRPASGFEAVTIAHPKGRKRWNGGGHHAVWQHQIVVNNNGRKPRFHTTQKPLPLMRELVRLFSEAGETILDPFAGSATTGVAALLEGRRFLGCELDETYVAAARERLERTQPEGTAATLLFGLPLGAA